MIGLTDEITLCSAMKRRGLVAIKYRSRGLVRGHVYLDIFSSQLRMFLLAPLICVA